MKNSNETSICGCTVTNEATAKCQNCNTKGTKITEITLKSQLKKEFYAEVKHPKDDFNFCNTPSCNTVYYSTDGEEVYNYSDN